MRCDALQALARALASGNAQAAGQAYAAALQKGGSAAAAATTVVATAIATANCNGVVATAIASELTSTLLQLTLSPFSICITVLQCHDPNKPQFLLQLPLPLLTAMALLPLQLQVD